MRSGHDEEFSNESSRKTVWRVLKWFCESFCEVLCRFFFHLKFFRFLLTFSFARNMEFSNALKRVRVTYNKKYKKLELFLRFNTFDSDRKKIFEKWLVFFFSRIRNIYCTLECRVKKIFSETFSFLNIYNKFSDYFFNILRNSFSLLVIFFSIFFYIIWFFSWSTWTILGLMLPPAFPFLLFKKENKKGRNFLFSRGIFFYDRRWLQLD